MDSGVHGVPYVPWQNDPTAGIVEGIGYCTHRSTLFMPWHRPYLMLYEVGTKNIWLSLADKPSKSSTPMLRRS